MQLLGFILISILTGRYLSDPVCNQIDNVNRFDCYPENGANENDCLNRGCCWSPPSQPEDVNQKYLQNVPYCYYSKDFPAYEVVSGESLPNGYLYSIEKSNNSFRPNEILKLEVRLMFESKERLRIKISDPNSKRYEVPVFKLNKKDKLDSEFGDDTDYQISVNQKPFFIKVFRKSTGKLM